MVCPLCRPWQFGLQAGAFSLTKPRQAESLDSNGDVLSCGWVLHNP
jgi:hypothetical protein